MCVYSRYGWYTFGGELYNYIPCMSVVMVDKPRYSRSVYLGKDGNLNRSIVYCVSKGDGIVMCYGAAQCTDITDEMITSE